ncbi:hypothetical protein H0E87_014565 [Populus deltoides]|uniref:Non-haem dioxygenase N-terminal domain-containing protein n=1 Tax=Populus deltoides TaxID=3696 RepID=A0A8T2YDV6_POPDE|nr:hypothetical protein H0E87_014565 [Populus deltoides]
MATDFKSIPIIDISPLVAKCDDPERVQDPDVLEVVGQLDQACREAGFFYVKGHGIPDSLIKDVKNVTRKFFDLPYEEKLKIKLSAAAGYRGYQRIGENITNGIPDMHEAIDCYREVTPGMYGTLGKIIEGVNQWPHDPPYFKVLMEEYISFCADLSRKIMRGIALALGGSADEFEGERAGDAFWVLRVIGYPGVSSTNGQNAPENDIGCGAHTDYGLVTLVNQDDGITALQVNHAIKVLISRIATVTMICYMLTKKKINSESLDFKSIVNIRNIVTLLSCLFCQPSVHNLQPGFTMLFIETIIVWTLV